MSGKPFKVPAYCGDGVLSIPHLADFCAPHPAKPLKQKFARISTALRAKVASVLVYLSGFLSFLLWSPGIPFCLINNELFLRRCFSFFFFSAFCFILSSPSKSKQSNKKRIQLLQENLTQSTIGSLSKIIMSLSALKENHLVNEYLLSAIYLQGTILYPGDSVVSVPESLSTMTCPLFSTAVLWKL